MFADPKARAVGDPITVVLAEQTSARSQNQFDDQSQAGFSGSATSSSGNRFGVDASVNQGASAQTAAAQSELLSGTFTAVVTAVGEGGALEIQGERSLNINGVKHLMKVSGTVRPHDVQDDNTVLSYRIANANVEYKQKGIAAKFFRPGTLMKAAAAALLGAAAFLVTQ